MTSHGDPTRNDPSPVPRPPRHPDLFESPVMEQAADAAAVLPEQGKGEIPSDTLGSYTGTPCDARCPQQDADDL